MPDAYPPATRLPIEEDLFAHRVADPYRWLEDAADPAVEAWSAAQDGVWSRWAGARPERAPLVARLEGMVPAFESAPTVVGDRRFWTRRPAGGNHAAIWVADAAGERPLVDPDAIDPDGKVTLDGWSPSLEGDRLAYLLSSGGDEESALRILDVATGEVLDGPIDRLRYSSLAWLPGGEELLYVRRLPPEAVPAGEGQFHRRVWRHRVGAPPDTDELVFGDADHGTEVDRTAYLGADVSDDGAWVAVTVALGTAPRNELWLAELPAAGAPTAWTAAVVGLDAQAWPAWDRDGALWVLTDLDAPRRRLVRADPRRPTPDAWEEILGEDPDGGILESWVLAGPHLVALRSRHAVSDVAVHDRRSGELLRTVDLPAPGTADLTGRRDEGDEAWVGYTSYVTPYVVGHLDPATGAVDGLGAADGAIRTITVRYQSLDRTEVRMTLIVPVDHDGTPRPTVLYGYGGFDVALSPAYSSTIRAWVEAGGAWAVANLRGGSEEGEAWHRDGMREHKHHVFEDFEAAADTLVEGGWTTREQLGIMGGSNGGLLVGAALTRSPERYRAVVCSAPLLDMVRYERFGLGATWNDEYGTADREEELGWLISYSPYHHVHEGTEYPAVLFTVFDRDTRVDPLHARKMAAALQWATTGDPAEAPVLVRREADVGHGARSVRRALELAADELVFLGHHTGLAFPAGGGG